MYIEVSFFGNLFLYCVLKLCSILAFVGGWLYYSFMYSYLDTLEPISFNLCLVELKSTSEKLGRYIIECKAPYWASNVGHDLKNASKLKYVY